MKRKLASIALALVMLLAFAPAAAFADEMSITSTMLISPNPNAGELVIAPNPEDAINPITVYMTFGMAGKLLNSKDGQPIAQLPVQLVGKESYNVDDALKAAHERFCENGAADYASDPLGAYVTKLWGDTSGNFNYQLNKGDAAIFGVADAVNDGDYLDAYVNQSGWPDNENFARFNCNTKVVEAGKSFELSLEIADFDENFQMVFFPCEGAEILVDGEPLEGVVTAADGSFSLSLEEGEHIISARKSKLVNDETVAAIAAPVCLVSAKTEVFSDVPVDAYYADAVAWAAEIKLAEGIGNGKFAPELSASRAEAVCFLWKLNGKPKAIITENPFTDVAADAYYYDAVLWAYENEIIKGMTPTSFAPDIKVDRAMMITLLYNMEKDKFPLMEYEKAGFADVAEDAYYAPAADWAKDAGIVKGTDQGLFQPEMACTRAMIVTLLYRLKV